jgi:hypothetical protein
MTPPSRPIATFYVGTNPMRLFADGTIEYKGESGNVAGAEAEVVTRNHSSAFLVVEGPAISLSGKVDSNATWLLKMAREFATAVNGLAASLPLASQS